MLLYISVKPFFYYGDRLRNGYHQKATALLVQDLCVTFNRFCS